MTLFVIPSPDQGVWTLGPVPVRAYAVCIIVGILVAVRMGEKRWVRRGGEPGLISDLAVWAVPFGIVGARVYHVLTDPELYFAPGRNPWRAFAIWEGGLGIWGAVAGGAIGVMLFCRRRQVHMSEVADTIAPGIVIAQAIGRLGNWFNQELFGKPTTLPWGLSIDPENRPSGYAGFEAFHPTFLYEGIWNLGLGVVLLYVSRHRPPGYGRLFALYVMGYTTGRFWIENLRIDTANTLFGIRLNVWTSVLVFAAAGLYFVIAGRRARQEDRKVDGLRSESGLDEGRVSPDANGASGLTQRD